jgi:uncharacterized membrane protein YdjX (TVP38/TMEM64 family)
MHAYQFNNAPKDLSPIKKENATVPEKAISTLPPEPQSLYDHLAMLVGAGPGMPNRREYLFFLTASILFILGFLGFLVYLYLEPVRQDLYRTMLDPKRLSNALDLCGFWGPFVFIGLQALQVLLFLWPVPLEIAGGYLFGLSWGTLYSTLGLALGTLMTFYLGRWLNKKWLNRLLGQGTREFLQRFIKREGALAAFLIYLLPGIPKDFIGYLFGMSSIPLPFFLLAATLARIPGTLLMSYQGAQAFQGHFGLTLASTAFSMVVGYIIFKYREDLYQWLERWDSEEG